MRIATWGSRPAARLATAVLIATAALAGVSAPSSAQPSKAALDAARAKLAQMNQQIDILTEQYDAAQVQLQKTQSQLAAAQAVVTKASSAARNAHTLLAQRTTAAYEGGVTSQLNLILGAQSFTELTDRLEFLNEMAAKDNDLATQAQVTGQKAQWASQTYQSLKAREQQQAAALANKKKQLENAAASQQQLVQKLQSQYKAAMKAAREAQKAAQQQAAAAPTSGGGTSSGTDVSGPPPPVSSRAAVAVSWARKAIGSPYKWGAAGPDAFDCSGLTMWAWGHAGVSLPHSAAAQYAAVPHVSKTDLQPGDLLFFYSPIHHVAMYAGGGSEIDASTEGVPVSEHGVDWGNFVGAGRPG